MKEWLEEKDLPRDCASCRYYGMNCADGYSCSKLNGREVHCNFSEGMGYRHKDCPLQSLADYTKQVRKEVVEEIKQKILDTTCYETEELLHSYVLSLNSGAVFNILDQIQGETNGSK